MPMLRIASKTCESSSMETGVPSMVIYGIGSHLLPSGRIDHAQAVLRKTMRAFFIQTDLDQRVRVVFAGVRIGNNAVHTDKLIHVRLPGFIIGLPENLNFLTLAKHHGAS